MTICAAALAAHSRAVVCIADKAISYGGYIQWDSDCSKMVQLAPAHPVLVMLAGDDRDTMEVISRLATVDDRPGNTLSQTKRTVEEQSKEAMDFLIDRLYLSPRQLTRTEYISAISGGQVNSYIKDIAQDIQGYEMGCSLLICGSEKSRMFILCMDSKGIVTDMTANGLHAIGSGSEKAM